MKTKMGIFQLKYKVVKNDFIRSLALNGIEKSKKMKKDYDKAISVLAELEKEFVLVAKPKCKASLKRIVDELYK